MSLDGQQNESALTSRDSLVEYFRAAERRGGKVLVGLEHEKLLVSRSSKRAIPYEGPQGVGALLGRFVKDGWAPVRESPELPIIALQRGQVTVSLEPGGQFELSGGPHGTARAAHRENVEHFSRLLEHTADLGVSVLTLGYRPFDGLAQMPWMPKSRYGAMRRTLGVRGSHALNMMLMTATGQVSFDWHDEADCARKVTAAARMVPVTVALFANSPIVDGAESGFLSYRSRVWDDVDAARCGTPSFMLDGSFSYERYVDWALEAPLLFLRRRGQYLTPAMTFRQLLEAGFEGQPALFSDWVDHLSTLFPEVRIKRVLEIRSADCNSLSLTGALAALMRGLLYDPLATEQLSEAMSMSPEAHAALHRLAQREGLRAPKILDCARTVMAIAKAGLSRLDPLDVPLLEPLEAIVQSGRAPAEFVIDAFRARTSEAAFVSAVAPSQTSDDAHRASAKGP
jgi:glutamate--cysteine ligase